MSYFTKEKFPRVLLVKDNKDTSLKKTLKFRDISDN